MFKKLLPIMAAIALVFAFTTCSSFADDTPYSVYVDGIKSELTFDDSHAMVTVSPDAKQLSIVRGSDKIGTTFCTNADLFPYCAFNPVTYADGVFIDDVGAETWEGASYDISTKTFSIPLSIIKNKCNGEIMLADENYGGYSLQVIVQAHEHTYGEPTYTWSEDNSTCTATATCTAGDCDNSEGKTVTETVTTTSVTTEATCKEKGVITYTATFTNEFFGTQTKDEDIEKKEHTWDEGKVTKEPTIDEEGVKTYTCTVCGETKTETIEKLTASENVEKIINELPKDVTLENKDKVDAARAAYEALTPEQQKSVSELALAKLELAEAKLAVAQAEADKLSAQQELAEAKAKLAVLEVQAKQVKKVKAKGQKKKAAISWKSLGKEYKYEVYTATKINGKYKKAVKATAKVKATVKKLKSKKVYYVKVRAFKTVNNKKVYTQYSEIISVKTK